MHTLNWTDHDADFWSSWAPGAEPVAVLGAPDDWYHGVSPGVSSSQLKQIIQHSELHLRYSLDNPEPRDEDYKRPSALLLGRVLHAVTFEAGTVDERFLFISVDNLSTKEGKAAWQEAEQRAAEQGLELVRASRESFEKTANAIRTHRGWAVVTGSAPLVEASIFWHDQQTGTLCKVRPDNLNLWGGISQKTPILADLKSAEDASDVAFRGAVKRYGYDLSAAMYCDGVLAWCKRQPAWYWLVFEKAPPYATRIVFAGPKWLARGRTLYREALGRYTVAARSGVWPGYDAGQAVELPFMPYDDLPRNP